MKYVVTLLSLYKIFLTIEEQEHHTEKSHVQMYLYLFINGWEILLFHVKHHLII